MNKGELAPETVAGWVRPHLKKEDANVRAGPEAGIRKRLARKADEILRPQAIKGSLFCASDLHDKPISFEFGRISLCIRYRPCYVVCICVSDGKLTRILWRRVSEKLTGIRSR